MMRFPAHWFQAPRHRLHRLVGCGSLTDLASAARINAAEEPAIFRIAEACFLTNRHETGNPRFPLATWRGSAPPPDALFPSRGMCYNHRAVERARKQELVSAGPQPADAVSPETAPPQDDANNVAPGADGPVSAESEDASRYCPICSRRLESRRCKLICPVCGYYMSCADYY